MAKRFVPEFKNDICHSKPLVLNIIAGTVGWNWNKTKWISMRYVWPDLKKINVIGFPDRKYFRIVQHYLVHSTQNKA